MLPPLPETGLLVLSWTAAIVASLGYGIGSVLQSIGATRTKRATDVGGAARIIVQVPYLLGLGIDLIAFLANVVALQDLPLFLVQAILTGSVAVTAIIAAIRGAVLNWKDWASLAVLALGLVLLSATARPESAVQIPLTAKYVVLATALVPIVIGLVGLRLTGRPSGLALAFAAGLAYTGVAVAARGLSGDRYGWFMLMDPLIWAIAVQGVIGTVCFALALQRASVTTVTAITFMVEMVVPAAIGLLVFGDSVRSGLQLFGVLGFFLALAGTISLVRFAE